MEKEKNSKITREEALRRLETARKLKREYVAKLEKEMKQAAADLQFERAAQLRDQIFEYKVRL